jgi:GNAT superfamily N-acetyltransferase
MNWFKKAQYENFNQWELKQILQKLRPVYRNFLRKENIGSLSPEDEIQMRQVGDKLDLVGKTLKEKIHKEREVSKKLIQEGKPYSVLPNNFMDYHNTGGISENAYKCYSDKKGISWLGGVDKYPILLKRKEYGGEVIEFRQTGKKNQYTQEDPKDPNGWDLLRDNEGNLICMTEEQIKQKGLPLYDTSITAFNSQGEPIGWASDEFGADGVWVVDEYQKRGIGRDLLYELRKQFKPDRRIGQMTGAGKNLTRSYHKKLVEEALKEGKEVPEETLKEYGLSGY